MSKYTHTEWLREGNTVYALNLEGSNRFYLQVQSGWATQGRMRTGDDEIEANARLIAAAPELFDFARDYISAYKNGFDGDEHLMLLAESLVAKVTGEPHG